MLLSATREDKSLQNGLNIFKTVFEHNGKDIVDAEAAQLAQEKMKDHSVKRKPGRPKKYQSNLRKSYHKPLSNNTAGYSIARKRLDISLVNTVFAHSCDFGDFDKELWHGMKTYLTDGTYLQLQDTADIKREYFVKGQEDSYPQALLQVLTRQGSGQISHFAVASRQTSELSLVGSHDEKIRREEFVAG